MIRRFLSVGNVVFEREFSPLRRFSTREDSVFFVSELDVDRFEVDKVNLEATTELPSVGKHYVRLADDEIPCPGSQFRDLLRESKDRCCVL